MTALETLRAAGLDAKVTGGQVKIAGLSRLGPSRREKAIRYAKDHRNEIMAELKCSPAPTMELREIGLQRPNFEADYYDRRIQQILEEMNSTGIRFTNLPTAERHHADRIEGLITVAANSLDRESFEVKLQEWRRCISEGANFSASAAVQF